MRICVFASLCSPLEKLSTVDLCLITGTGSNLTATLNTGCDDNNMQANYTSNQKMGVHFTPAQS